MNLTYVFWYREMDIDANSSPGKYDSALVAIYMQ